MAKENEIAVDAMRERSKLSTNFLSLKLAEKICAATSELENRRINFLNFVSSLGEEILNNVAIGKCDKKYSSNEIQYKGGKLCSFEKQS